MRARPFYSRTSDDTETVHLVTLTNGERIGIHEREDGLSISRWRDQEPDAYLCRINENGVLVYANSGDAVDLLVTDLEFKL